MGRAEDLAKLGLANDGTAYDDKALVKAYRKQALKKHPDKGGSTVAFQVLSAAYERLSSGHSYVELRRTTTSPSYSPPAYEEDTPYWNDQYYRFFADDFEHYADFGEFYSRFMSHDQEGKGEGTSPKCEKRL